MRNITRLTISLMLTLALGLSVAASDKKSSKKELAKEAKITMKQAREIALKEVSGKIKEGELEREDGHLIYSFDIQTKDGIKEVQVDAIDGKVLKVESETKEDEAKEKAHDKKGAKKP